MAEKVSSVFYTQQRTTVGRTPLDAETSDNAQNKHRCPRWDSNPQTQQASSRKPMP